MRLGRRAAIALLTVSGLAASSIAAGATRIVAVMTCGSVEEPGTVPTDIRDRFPGEAPKIHAVIVLADTRVGTRIDGTWVSVNAIETPNYEIDTASVVADRGDARVHFSLSRPTKGWPAGDYRLDLRIDGTFVTSIPFSVGRNDARPPQVAARSPAKPQPPPAAPPPRPAGSSLQGAWVCRSPEGEAVLEFVSANRLVFNGEASSYELVPGAIRVQEQGYGAVDYRYALRGDELSVVFPDGYQLECRRTGGAQGGAPGPEAAGLGAMPPGSQGAGGQEYLLSGPFCHWAGSSSSSSSYSRSSRAYFDGRGGFTYGSESSFSSGAGIAYGGNANPGNTGTYRVLGDQVQLSFGDGSTGTARIYNRAGNGRITELMYEGALYAPQLCQ